MLAARRVLGKAINGVLQGKKRLDLSARFARWALQVATERDDSRLTVISTNYDTAFELPLFKLFVQHGISVGRHVDLGMPWRDAFKDLLHVRPSPARLALYKLHGSLNWLRCEVCGHVTMNVRQRIASPESWSGPSPGKYNVCWCGGLLRSLLVAPSVVRDVRDASLLGIWKAALEDLRSADEWIFVGYSLPAEDIAIRSLLLRAWHARRRKRLRVQVVQCEEGRQGPSDTYNRYRLLFPPANLKESDYSRGGVQPFVDRPRCRGPRRDGADTRRPSGGDRGGGMLKLMGPWPVLVMAGLLEVTWAVGLKASDGFRRPVASSVTVVALIGSLYLLALALRELPVSTGYAVWTGIGALGTAIVGMTFLGEPRGALARGVDPADRRRHHRVEARERRPRVTRGGAERATGQNVGRTFRSAAVPQNVNRPTRRITSLYGT